jgi:glycogen synthase
MKILYWTPLFWPDIGGIERLSMDVLPALRGRGHEITVITSHSDRALADVGVYDGIPVYRFPFLTSLWTHDGRRIVRIQHQVSELKRLHKPDLVHIHFAAPISYFHLATANAHPSVTLVTVHGVLPGYRAGSDTLLGQTLRRADWVTAVSGPVLASLRELVPEIESRSTVIRNGVAALEITPGAPRFDIPRILCVARLEQEKGVDLALQAFALLVDRFPQARLLIAGDGSNRRDLEYLAARLRVTDAMEFLGWVPPHDVPRLMESAAIVVIPSRHEGSGLVALEAALMARPVIATRVGGLLESVVHRQTGLLVAPHDPAAFADALAYLLDHPAVAIQMGEAGRFRVLTTFSLTACVDAYDRLYRRWSRTPESAKEAFTA